MIKIFNLVAIFFILITSFNNYSNTEEPADTSGNKWISKIPNDSDKVRPGNRGCVAVYGSNKLIAFGGMDDQFLVKNDLWMYESLTNTWKQMIADNVQGSPSTRYSHAMVCIGSEVVMFGGNRKAYIHNLNDTWLYDTNANVWTQKIANDSPNSPLARGGHKMVWDGSKGIMFGGYNDTATHMSDLWWYDPATNVWTQKIENGAFGSPVARSGHEMVWDGTRVIMFGGNDGTLKNDLWWYDPVTNIWKEKIAKKIKTSPLPRQSFCMIWTGNKVIMFGGDITGEKDMNDLWWYDPAANTWTQKIENGAPDSPVARSGHEMVWDGEKAIMFGGNDASDKILTDLWWFIP